jgi:phosphoribosylanthranilate isomerase
VGVFVNATVEEVLEAVDDCGLYIVQLHGDETPKYCEKIANYVTVVKAFRLREDDNVLWKVKDYRTSRICFFLIPKVQAMAEQEKNSTGIL